MKSVSQNSECPGTFQNTTLECCRHVNLFSSSEFLYFLFRGTYLR
jgi:hypothetical protein